MLFNRFYDEKLAQASYLIACQATGEAIVIDPHRDIGQYLGYAGSQNVRISHVSETHIHADFLSGARELAEATGAQLLLSAEGGRDWSYGFARSSNAVNLRDGGTFSVGRLRFEVLHTPGHTPEHLVFLVTDTPATGAPIGALTGDCLFVGDVGRPDLLEKAANIIGTMEAGARDLFRSLQRLRQLPAHLQIWPGHGAGSACGKSLGAMPSSTLGYELAVNWAFQIIDETRFVSEVLSGQPEPPRYFALMKKWNREGPPPRPRRNELPQAVDAAALLRLLESQNGAAQVVDLRSAADFARAHIPGTINIPHNRSFTNWAGALLDYSRPLTLVVDEDRLQQAVTDLAMVGLDDVQSFAGTVVVEDWRALVRPIEALPELSVAQAAQATASGATIVDVRRLDEWEAGHPAGAIHLPLTALPDRIGTLPNGPLLMICQTGSRSAIAASLVQASGRPGVANVAGGYSKWRAAGLPTESSVAVPRALTA
ncbi:MAG: MBL fold metallo-hydrolase [Gemmatimonadota bacterium]